MSTRNKQEAPAPGFAAACFIAAVMTLACSSAPGAPPGPEDQRAAKAPGLPSEPQPEPAAQSASPSVRYYGYEIVARYPHDESAFTQGLAFHEGYLYEGTGRRGESSLRQVQIETGRALQQVDLEPALFGEGVAILDGRIYQLTWLSRKAFVYSLDDFALLDERVLDTEGWGLASHGEALVQSDGSATLRWLDPATFEVTATVIVRGEDGPVSQVNELEVVGDEIWANVWHSDEILRIDADTGDVTGRIDMAGLRQPDWRQDPEAVFNGIAVDGASGRIFVTGKLWPVLYEVRIVPRDEQG